MRTRRSMRSASDSPDLQDSIRDSLSARVDCAGVSVCTQAFLLNLETERDRYEESKKHACRRCCRACFDRSSFCVAQDCNFECFQNDLRSMPDNGKESTPKSSGSLKNRCAVRKETGRGHIRRFKNQHRRACESHNQCWLPVTA